MSPVSPALTVLSGRASDSFCIPTRFHEIWKKRSKDHFICLIVKGKKITYKPLSFVLFSKLCLLELDQIFETVIIGNLYLLSF